MLINQELTQGLCIWKLKQMAMKIFTENEDIPQENGLIKLVPTLKLVSDTIEISAGGSCSTL